jgi:hypothetical protein
MTRARRGSDIIVDRMFATSVVMVTTEAGAEIAALAGRGKGLY